MSSGRYSRSAERIEIRVKSWEKELVNRVAKELKMTVSEFIRKLLFDNLYFEIEKERIDVGFGERELSYGKIKKED